MTSALALDIGGTSVRCAFLRSDGELSGYTEVKTKSNSDAQEEILTTILSCVRGRMSSAGDSTLEGIGVGVPGAVTSSGVISDLPNLPTLNGVALGSILQTEFGITVRIDNSANNAARGESAFGAAQDARDFLLVTLGTGVGGGLFLNGDLYTGSVGYAAEFGHMKLFPYGRACGCGAHGCWEAYGSGPALAAHAALLMDADGAIETALQRDSLRPQSIIEAATAGDALAEKVFDDYCRFNALGIASLINLFNPSVCVIGGGVAAAGNTLLTRVQSHAKDHTLRRAWASARWAISELGQDAGLLGAGSLILNYKKKDGGHS